MPSVSSSSNTKTATNPQQSKDQDPIDLPHGDLRHKLTPTKSKTNSMDHDPAIPFQKDQSVSLLRLAC